MDSGSLYLLRVLEGNVEKPKTHEARMRDFRKVTSSRFHHSFDMMSTLMVADGTSLLLR